MTTVATPPESSTEEISKVLIEESSESESEFIARSIDVGSVYSMNEKLVPWIGTLIWPLLLTLPLTLSSTWSPTSYAELFPADWYSYDGVAPKPLGLVLGILAVAVGQVFVLLYFYLHKHGYLSGGTNPRSIQTRGAPVYQYVEGVYTHLSQPEGFVLLVGYLASTWLMNWMPDSYYNFEGTIQWQETLICLVVQDGLQFLMHRLEHSVNSRFYRMSHKPHHRFTNPRLFDAFNGSVTDTVCMILIPLFLTANLVRTCNVWTYMAFGSLYANWLTLIHSEHAFPWDGLFRTLGMGTPGDHHVHHKFFKYNFGHLFMWFDQLSGTYRSPRDFSSRAFNRNV